MTGEYRVPKESRRVRLQMVDGRELEGHVFLRPAIEGGPPAQEVLDLLNEPERFLPLGLADGTVILVAKSAIRAACHSAPEEVAPAASESDPEGAEASGNSVEVVGTAGARYRGWLEYVLPPSRRRLSDALNRPEGRFLKVVGGKEIWCVNCDSIAFVRPLHPEDR